MPMTNINIRTDSEIKRQAQEVFARLGLDMTTAINLFLRQTINKEAVSFELATMPKTPKLGGWEGKIRIPDDFSAPLDDFEE